MESESLPEIAQDIISRADKWTFEGDCMILKWMEQISQNLENRAKTTTESLDKLQKNFNRAQIALENTQNNLIALQYTQYVEMRCQDDESPMEPETEHHEKIEKTPDEVLKTFLQNNLKMLNNCHDKFSFLEDSEEEDSAPTIENCVYQPRNPYNERLLPHIFGTRMWKENWHIGLCDESAMDYSGDEVSEVYSISSASSGAGSLQSHNTASLSQWTSSTSMNNENTSKTSNMHASTLVPQLPNVSTTSILQASNLPPSEPKSVSPESNFLKASDLSSENIVRNEPTATIEEPIKDQQSEFSNLSKKKPMQCKTLNLFDDNDFNSLMSEIVDKANIKNDRSVASTSTVNSQNSVRKESKINLFGDESNSDIPNLKVVPPISKNGVEKKISTSSEKLTKVNTEKAKKKEKSVNLFDSPTEDFAPIGSGSKRDSKFDFFKDLNEDTRDNSKRTPSLSTSTSSTPRHEVRTKISAKSLFDDDDNDDEDFLSLFGKGKPNTQTDDRKQTIPKDDFDVKKPIKTIIDDSILFSENKEKEENIQSKAEVVINAETKKIREETSKLETQNPNQISKPLLFDDDDFEDDLFVKKPSKQVKEVNKPLPFFLNSQPPEDIEPPLIKDKEEFNSPDTENDSDDEWFSSLGKSKSKNFSNTAFEKNQEVSKNPERISAETSIVNEDSISTKINPGTQNVTEFFEKSVNEIVDVSNSVLQKEEPPKKEEHFIVEPKPVGDSISIPEEVNEHKKFDLEIHCHSSLEEETKETQTEIEISQESNEETLPTEIKNTEAETSKDLNEKIDNTPIFDNYSSLFLDEPPDDDFFQTMNSISQTNVENDFFEPSAFNKQADESNRSSMGYDIGFFNDFPPEDEGDTEDQEKTASTNSSPTISTTTAAAKTLSESTSPQIKPTSFINEFPPPDDNYEKVTPNTQTNPEKDVPDHKARVTELPVAESFDKSKDGRNNTVSKLKMPKININVQALLPNASGKRPNIRPNTEAENQSSNESIVPIESKPSRMATVTSDTSVEQDRRDLLPNLCKNRVRVPVKRKSSTRAARKESYQKTLLLEQKQEEEVKSEERPKIVAPPKQEVNNKAVAPATISIPKKVETEIQKSKETYINPKVIEPIKKINPPAANVTESPHVKTSISSRIFNDSDENSDDDFFNNLVKPKITASSPAVIIANQSDDSDNDLFRSEGIEGSKSLTKQNQEVKKTHNISKPKIESNKLNALFANNSNEEDDDDDDLFSSLSKPKITFPSPNIPKPMDLPKSVPTKSKDKSLFSDSEDDDDLFGNSLPKPKSATSTSVASMTSKGAIKKLPQPKPTQAKAPIKKSTDNPLADLLDP